MVKKFKAEWNDMRYEGITSTVEAESKEEVYGMSGQFFFDQGGSGNMPCPDYVEEKRGRGRPPKFKKSTPHPIRIDDEVWERIPGKKSEFVRDAIKKALK